MKLYKFKTMKKYLLIFALLLGAVWSWGQTSNTVTQTWSGNGTFTVPSGITSVSIIAIGGAGGHGGSDGRGTGYNYGGPKGYVSGSFTVTPGSSLSVYVGSSGADGASAAGGSGGGAGGSGYYSGGYGGNTGSTGTSGAGGGGGGASGVTNVSPACVAGGAGGGGGRCNTANSGSGGSSTQGGAGGTTGGTGWCPGSDDGGGGGGGGGGTTGGSGGPKPSQQLNGEWEGLGGNCGANSSGSTTTTSAAMVSISYTVYGGTASPSTQTICSGGSPGDITLTGYIGTIQWQVSSNGSSFSTISGATGATLTSAQMGTLTSTMYYRAYVNGAVSNTATVTIYALTSTPSSASCTGTTQSTASLSWGSSSGQGTITYYWVVGTSSGITYPNGSIPGRYGSTTDPTKIATASGLSASTGYYLRVYAHGDCGNSADYATSGMFTTVPLAPVATAATNIRANLFRANWNASTGATKYYLDVSTVSNFSSFVTGYNNKDVGNNTYCDLSLLNRNTNYYYRVRAYNAGGSSVNSNDISLTTLPLNNFLVEKVGGGAIPDQLAGLAFNIRITARDSYNTTVTDYTGNVTMTTNSVLTSGGTTANFSVGVLSSHSVTLTQAGTGKTLTATNGSTGTSNTFTVVPAALDHFTLSTEHSSTEVAGTAFTVTATAYDQYGNIKTNYNGGYTVNWTTTATSSRNNTPRIIPAGGTQTFASGVATVGGFTFFNAHEFPTITIQDVNTTKSGTTSPITVTPLAMSNFKVETGTTQVAGVSFGVTVTARDIYYNTATSYNGNIRFKSSNDALVTYPAGLQTMNGYNGVRVFPSSSISICTAGAYWLRAADAVFAYKSGQQENIVVGPAAIEAGSPSTLVVDYDSRIAGEYVHVTVTPKDACGNLVRSCQPITILLDGSTSDYNGPIVVTAHPLDGTYTADVRVTKTTTQTISAKYSTTPFTQTRVINVHSAAPNYLAVTGGATQVAGATNPITVTAYDIFNNVATDYIGDKVLNFSGANASPALPPSPSAVPTVGGINFGSNTTLTFTAGVASANMVLYKVETAHINTTDGTLTATAHKLDVAVSHASPNFYAITGNSNQVAGVNQTITVTTYDFYNNVATGYAGSKTLTFSGAGVSPAPATTPKINGTSFGTGTALTFASGVATGSMGLYLVETANITATDGGSPTAITAGQHKLTVAVSHGTPNYFAVTGSATQVAGTSQVITIKAYDAYNNLATGYAGTSLSFGGANDSPAPPYHPTVNDVNFGTSTPVSFSGGTATASMVLFKVETAHVTASDGSINADSHRLDVNVTYAPPAYLKITGNASQVAGTTQTITITAYDQFNNVSTGYAGPQVLTFTGANPSPAPAFIPTAGGTIFGDNITLTFVNGVVTTPMVLYKVEPAVITVHDAIHLLDADLHTLLVNVTQASPNYLAVTGTGTQLAGTSQVITVTACDAYNNVATAYTGAKTLTFSGANPSPAPSTYPKVGTNAFGSGTSLTFSNGVATGTMYLYKSETALITATDLTINADNHKLTVVVSHATPSYLAVTGTGTQTAGGSQLITVTTYDVYNNVATGYTGAKTLTFSGADPSPSPATNPTVAGTNFGTGTSLTFASGVATGTMYLYKVQTAHVTATDLTINADLHKLDVIVSHATPDYFAITGTSTQTAGTSQVITVTAYDAYNNVATGYTSAHSLTFAGANPSPSPATDPTVAGTAFGTGTSLTFTNGVATGTMYLYKAESAQVTTTDGTINADLHKLAVTVNHNTPAYLAVTGNTTQVAGASQTITVSAYDTYNNLATGYVGSKPLVFSGANLSPAPSTSPTVGGINFGSQTNLTFAGGTVSATMFLYKVETALVNVTDGSLNAALHKLSVVVSHATPNYLAITGSGTQVAGFSQNITISAFDVYNNLATGYDGNHSLTFSGANPSPAPATNPTVNGIDFGTATTVSFSSGVASLVPMFLFKTETAVVTATDGTITANAHTLTVVVSHAAASYFTLNAPADIVAGGARAAYIVSRFDYYNNPATTGAQVVYITSSSTGANKHFYTAATGGSVITQVTIANASSTASFYYYDEKAGDWTIRASENPPGAYTPGGITDATDQITVIPTVLKDFIVEGIENPHDLGTHQSVTVTARDTYDNVKTNYYGTVTFSNTDIGATNPADYTYIPATDHGIHTFTNGVLFSQIGSWWLTAIDVGDPTKYGAQADIIVQKAVYIYADNQSKTYGQTKNLGHTAFTAEGGIYYTQGEITSVDLSSSGTGATAHAGNYDITPSNASGPPPFNAAYYHIHYETGNLKVDPRTLTLSSFTASNKQYDRNTDVSGTSFSDDRISGDQLSFSFTAAFENRHAGVGKTVNYTGITISGGSDAGNYTLASTTGSTTATITPKPVTPSITASNKCYDGNTTATLSSQTVSGVIDPDVVTLLNTAANFNSSTVGTGKTVTATGLTLGGADKDNYTLGATTQVQTTATVEIYALPEPTISGSALVCQGSDETYTTESGKASYLWSVPTGGTITAGEDTYSITVSWTTSGARTVTVNYSDSHGCRAASSTIKNVSVLPLYAVGSISDDQDICYNTTPAQLTGVAPTGGQAPYSYQWERSTGGGYTDISGATVLNYQPGALTTTTDYRLKQTSSNGCGTLTTNHVTITVYNLLTAGTASSAQTICYGETPQSLGSTLPGGGSGTFSYQWQYLAGETWTDITGATSLTYSPGALTATTLYKLKQTDTHCSPIQVVSTNTVTISVYNLFVAGTATAAQTICYGETPAGLNSTAPTGGSGVANFSYQWQACQTGVGKVECDWVDIPGATNLTYAPGPLTGNTIYRLVQTDNYCDPDDVVYTNTVIITVYPELKAGVANSDQTICYGETPAGMTAAAPTGGSGTYGYQWQIWNTTTSLWDNINGATALTYGPGALTVTATYRLEQTDAYCNPDDVVYTNEVTKTVHGQLFAGTASENQTICYGETPAQLEATAPSGGSGTFTYQWQSKDNGSGYIPSWINIPGATDLNYSPVPLTKTTEYRVKQTDTYCNPDQEVISNTVTITVHGQLVKGSVGTAQTICYGETPNALTAVAPAGGSGTFSYQWQKYNGTGWDDIAGETELIFAPGAMTASATYHLKQTDTYCDPDQVVYTDGVTITVHGVLVAGTAGTAQTICYGEAPSVLSAGTPAGGSGTFIYQWQVYTVGTGMSIGVWENIPGATNPTYSPGFLTSTAEYRQKQTDTYCNPDQEVFTNSVTITVHGQLVHGTATADQTICYDETPKTLNAAAPTGGSGTFSYQWQVETNPLAGDPSPWTNIPGATDLAYSPGPLTKTTAYHMVQTDTYCNPDQAVTTNDVTITVHNLLVAGTASASHTICYGETSPELSSTAPEGGSGSFTYQWQSSLNNSTFSNIEGATTLSYSPGVLTATTYYQVEQTDTYCTPDDVVTTNVVTITVHGLLVAGAATADQTICYNETPSPVSADAPTGGSGTFAYQWQIWNTGTTVWDNITGATALSYVIGPLTVTTTYRLEQTDTYCTPDDVVYTNEVTKTVHAELIAGTAAASQTICYGETAAQLSATVPSGGSGTFTYQWQLKNPTQGYTQTEWIDISGATTLTYSPGAMTAPATYRLKQTDTYCTPDDEVFTNEVTITVYGQLVAGTATAPQTICYGETPASLSSTAPGGGSGTIVYQWQHFVSSRWADLSGATTLNYAPGALTGSETYRLRQTDTYCNPDHIVYTNSVIITVHPILVAGTAGSNQSICNGEAPETMNAIAPTGGSSSFSYQWQVQNGSAWDDLSGATILDYSPGTLTSTKVYRVKQTDTYCHPADEVFTNEVTITVYDVLVAGTAGSAQTICNGETPATLSAVAPTGGSGTFGYQWLIKNYDQSNSPGLWHEIQGATNLTYSPGALTKSETYRLQQTDAYCNPDDVVWTNEVTITVYNVLAAGTAGSDQTICNGETPAPLLAIVPSGGSGTFSYLWQVKDGSSWVDLVGETSLGFAPGALTTSTTYRLQQTDTYCNPDDLVWTNEVTITVYNALTAGTAGSNQSICNGETPAALSASVPGGGSGTFSYQWQSKDGSSWVDITGATTLTYAPGALTASATYRLQQTDTYCNPDDVVFTNEVNITVYSVLVAGTISPDHQTICYGETPTMTATAPTTGSGTFSYQWQYYGVGPASNGFDWHNIPGATSLTYSPGALFASATYRLEQTDTWCNPDQVVHTNGVTITVHPQLIHGTAGSDQTICAKQAPATLTSVGPTGGSGDFVYQWQILNGSNWDDIAGATNFNYSPGALTTATHYRVKQTDTFCAPDQVVYTNEVIITVNPTPELVITNPSVCAPAKVDLTAPEVTAGSILYGATLSYWFDVNGTNPVLNPAAVSSGTYYIKAERPDHCSDIKPVIAIVNNLPTLYTGTGSGNYCETANPPGLIVGLSGSQIGVNYTLWNGGIQVSAVIPGTGSPISFGRQSSPGLHYVIAENTTTGCISRMDHCISITIDPALPVSVTIAASANQITAGTPVIFTPTPVNGGASPSYQWQVNGQNVGTGATYTYAPVNYDEVSCILTSNATCITGNPATSNTITMVVTGVAPVITVTGNVANGQVKCYNALQTLTVAGSGTTFIVKNGGHATMIAGTNILYEPGTKVELGGYMLGKIYDGSYCTQGPTVPAVITGQEETVFGIEQTFFSIYPNPTSGNFTLVQKGDRAYGSVRIEIFTMSGERVMTERMIGEKKHEFHFSDVPVGLYFVKVIADDYVETIKLVKTR